MPSFVSITMVWEVLLHTSFSLECISWLCVVFIFNVFCVRSKLHCLTVPSTLPVRTAFFSGHSGLMSTHEILKRNKNRENKFDFFKLLILLRVCDIKMCQLKNKGKNAKNYFSLWALRVTWAWYAWFPQTKLFESAGKGSITQRLLEGPPYTSQPSLLTAKPDDWYQLGDGNNNVWSMTRKIRLLDKQMQKQFSSMKTGKNPRNHRLKKELHENIENCAMLPLSGEWMNVMDNTM